MFAVDQKSIMLKLARDAVSEFVAKRTETSWPQDDFLKAPSGAFVTLKKNHDLRGCIGYTEPRFPLGETIVKAAVAASSNDPRFPPVLAEEIELLKIEISVLSAFQTIFDVNEIEVGKHGLMVKAGYRRGLLLPQVAIEENWDRETFLNYTCHKAGLPFHYWRTNQLSIEVFSADVFGEE